MVKNKRDELWFVTKKSFGRIDPSSGDILYKNEQISNGLSIHSDDKGNLWLGTKNGLYFNDYQNSIQIQHPELKHMIGSVIKADNDHLAYGGLRGIGLLNLKEFYAIYDRLENTTAKINAESFVSYYSDSHGFMGEEIGQNGMFKDSKNRIWVPTNNNVVMFDPKDLRKNKKAPNTYITALESSEDNINWVKFDTVKTLDHAHNNIRINYIGISHADPNLSLIHISEPTRPY